jgi:alpha-tubulin suppressor-like RCC1 family protein
MLATSPAAASEALPCRTADKGALSCWNGELRRRAVEAPGARLVKVAPPGVAEIVTTHDRACALSRTGALTCWGVNDSGNLGDGTRTHRDAPTPVLGIDDAIAVALGGSQSCALRRSGTVACWGYDDAKRTYQLRPTAVASLRDVVEVSAGHGHACARRVDGSVWCWGYNRYGQLGDGTQKDRRRPTQVAGIIDAVELAAGYYHTCARSRNGAVACWGNGWGGEDGTDDRLLVPAKVSAIRRATGIVAVDNGFVALQKNGRFVTCRYRVGQTESESSPTLVCRETRTLDARALGGVKTAVRR